MQWFILALSAAIIWGACYSLDEQLFKHVTVPSVIFTSCWFTLLVSGSWIYYKGMWREDVAAVLSSGRVAALLATTCVFSTLGGCLICSSIAQKNASIAGIIESSYPIFIPFFSYLLSGEINLSKPTMFGGCLIGLGLGIIHRFG